jgi:hypothetical protein
MQDVWQKRGDGDTCQLERSQGLGSAGAARVARRSTATYGGDVFSTGRTRYQIAAAYRGAVLMW